VARLRAGAAALGLALTDGQIEALLDFSRLLLRWNQVHNLTAIRTGEDFLTHHLLDSLALVAPLNAALARRGLRSARGSARVLDVGAGGGLPGIPLAIACPHLQVTLIDAVQKKAAFLTQVALELRLSNVSVHHGRVEQYRGQFDVITSRAFAALADFVTWTRHLLGPGGCWLAMKARLDDDELQALPAGVQVASTLPLSVPGLNEQRHLLEICPT
jgi:16S rRNA (guanine527-N7)-methyltransferase